MSHYPSSTSVDPELMQEVRLYENSAEREQTDNLSELYAVINSLECLEKLFSRDFISSNEYTTECSKLLGQFKIALKFVQGTDINEFIRKYRIKCPAALERIKEDRPNILRDDKGNTYKCIASTVELFITILDQFKLNIRAVDELHPTLSDLYATINSMSSLPDNFDAKIKVKNWYDKLNGMAAHEELSDEMARQMVFELENAYNSFNRFLQNS